MMKKHIHFMGIGGSGMSAVALLAKHAGFEVSGCDLQESTPYLDKCKNAGIKLYVGHDKSHLKDIDIFAITAATFFQSQDQPEFIAGKKLKKMMQWQEFMAKYLHQGKEVISIAGTNGKSTTTALAALVLEEAGLDPSVMIGATMKKWGTNYRAGKSKYFAVESDEFFDNFLAYHPNIIILNNIEFDHPDFFKSFDHVLNTFKKFVGNLKGEKTLIFNQDDPGIKKLFTKLEKRRLSALNLIGYTLKTRPLIKVENSTRGLIKTTSPKGTVFEAINPNLKLKSRFNLILPGDYNVSNALGVITLAAMLGIKPQIMNSVFRNFEGIGRRLDKIGETKNKIIVYDDYGHHPSAIKVTLEALKQRYPKQKIWTIIEPHGFSRTKATLP
ncbi:MAG: Mur ligase family protein, partial [Microgenomates group bacterium]